jgi:type III restriction enzyme
LNGTIDRLIINSPFEEPKNYWSFDRETRTFSKKEGRRPAGYVIATQAARSFDDPGIFIEIELVNKIRPRVKKWREEGYANVTGITKRLLEHWHNNEERENKRLFFCQLEAIETLVWFNEAPASEKTGIVIPKDGGEFTRICSKMATGSGKTIVMAMLIAYHILNKITYPQDTRFSKNIFIVAPGLTVKSRLQVLIPAGRNNYYDEFNIVPAALYDKLRQGKVKIENWHSLAWDTEEKLAKKKTVDKRGVKSDEAYVKEVLREISNASNILVINDEAHHAWRVQPELKVKREFEEQKNEATVWVGGLDRIHRTRGILTCYDFTATPFAPSGKQSSEEALFEWIVSDFGLNDAIESGLVKTPRVVIRDDSNLTKEYKSRLYHIYNDDEVKDDVNRKAEEHEPLPDLVLQAYYLLGLDWRETKLLWEETGQKTPPVMISVANRTETAARIKYSFDHKKIKIDELCNPERTLHIDSKVLETAEAQNESILNLGNEQDKTEDDIPIKKLTKQVLAEMLRLTVDSVGQKGKAGEKIQNVISVGMLSEGWDAKTVTHILGLRAFTSQLLCEQVVGRGLRRTTYEVNPETGLYEAEYVNIFGIPFTFLPHEEHDGPPPPPPPPKNKIEPVEEKKEYEIIWPNIIRINHTYKPKLNLDVNKVKPIEIDAFKTPTLAELAPIIDGKPDISKLTEIDLEKLGKEFRWQKIIFETARDVFDQMKPTWQGNKEYLLAQVIRIVEKFINSDKIIIQPALFDVDELRRRILITLNMIKVVQHVWEAIRFENTQELVPIFDSDYPIRSTSYMKTWYTGRPCEVTKKSHINLCVFDSTWEASEAFEFDRNENVKAWVKNDHLGFEIHYIYKGLVKKYRPDYLIKLSNDINLILEVKGRDDDENKTKRYFLNEWINAVNKNGSFGIWKWAVSKYPTDLKEILTLR